MAAEASLALGEQVRAQRTASRIGRVALAFATAFVILAAALLLLMTPAWMHFALVASGGTNALATPDASLSLSDRTIAELFMGPGTFSGFPADQASHLRDVRVLLFGFLGLAAIGGGIIGWRLARAADDPVTWRSIARGGGALAVLLVVAGLLAAFAFDITFETFHRIFFPAGNWSFPLGSLINTLYPLLFWQLCVAAMGTLGIIGGFIVWFLARRRARALERSPAS